MKHTKPGTGLLLGSEQAKIYGRRGGLMKRRNRTICIEGDYVTTVELAKILGVTLATAQQRLKRAQKRPEPVTWERMGRKQ